MSIGKRIKEERTRLGLSQFEVAKAIDSTKQAVYKYENGIVTNIPTDKIEKMAKLFRITPAELMGWQENHSEKAPDTRSNAILLDNKDIYMIPVFESVSAGFGTIADNTPVDYTPIHFFSSSEAENTICVKVKGDSMFPKIEDGDMIQIYKTDSVDSGTIAVILMDGEEALVKKVVYGSDWIELHSINPMYPVMRFEKSDVLRLSVLGQVKRIIKSV